MEKTRILVIDDDALLSQLVKAVLEKTRLYMVREENRATHALAAAREFRPHLVLLDVDMPSKDGGTVARELRADPALAGTPILFFTSLLSPGETGVTAICSGNDQFLAKPVESRALISCIEKMLQQTPAG